MSQLGEFEKEIYVEPAEIPIRREEPQREPKRIAVPDPARPAGGRQAGC